MTEKPPLGFNFLAAEHLVTDKTKCMNKVTIIEAEWNCYNGFHFALLHIESWKFIDMDSAFFSISFSKNFLYLNVIFLTIKIFDNEIRK